MIIVALVAAVVIMMLMAVCMCISVFKLDMLRYLFENLGVRVDKNGFSDHNHRFLQILHSSCIAILAPADIATRSSRLKKIHKIARYSHDQR